MDELVQGPYAELANLLAETFSGSAGINTFLDEAQLGDIASRLRQSPDSNVYATDVVQALGRRGLVDEHFLESLRTVEPSLNELVSQLAAELGLETTLTDATAPLSLGDNPPILSSSEYWYETPAVEKTTAPMTGIRPQRLAELAEITRGVVRLRGTTGPLATGFFVTPTLVLSADYTHQGSVNGVELTDNPTSSPPILPLDGEPTVVASARAVLIRVAADNAQPTLQLSRARPAVSSQLFVIHHPNGGVKQVASGTLDGYGTSDRSEVIRYTLPAAPGSGGAPILDEDLRVISWVYAHLEAEAGNQGGRSGYGPVAGVALGAIERDHPDLWLEIMAAQPHLRRVDPAVKRLIDLGDSEASSSPAGAIFSIVLRMSEPNIVLDVTGFDETSRWDHYIAGSATLNALAVLAERDDVLNIDLSRDGGSVETRVGLPAVHAPIVQIPPTVDETGDECLVAVIDSGLDVFHEAFSGQDGTTRVLAFWDQTYGDGTSFTAESAAGVATGDQWGLRYGRLWLKSDIDAMRALGVPAAAFPAVSEMEHGTLVTSIAAGRRTGDNGTDFFGGVAQDARILAVRFKPGEAVAYENAHIDALSLAQKVADTHNLPLVVNISSGINGGGHDGRSNLEKFCDQFAAAGNSLIVKSAGNEGQTGRHARCKISHGMNEEISWLASEEDGSDLLQFWLPKNVNCEFTLISPLPGQDSGIINENGFPTFDEILAGTQVHIAYSPYFENGDHRLEVRLDPLPGSQVAAGRWTLRMRETLGVANQKADGWIEIGARSTRFETPDPQATITIPGTAEHVLCVNASNPGDPQAKYQGASQGPARRGDEKPDLCAPGVGIRAAGGTTPVSEAGPQDGSSLAAPFVAGAIALVMSRRRKAIPPKSSLTPARVAGLLRESCITEQNASWDEYLGWGRLDVTQLLKLADNVP